MITKSIKAPGFLTRLADVVGHRQQQQFHGMRTSPAPIDVGPIPRLPKHLFGQFIEQVKKEFKQGDLVVFKHFVPIPGRLPSALYKIETINELWYDCILDQAIGIDQPRCLYIRMVGMRDTTETGFSTAPVRMRHLTTEEKALVDLQNSPVQGTA